MLRFDLLHFAQIVSCQLFADTHEIAGAKLSIVNYSLTLMRSLALSYL